MILQVLNIREDASEEDIRKAKRMLSLQTHPDKSGQSPGTSIAFQRVLEASEILLDEQSRLQYDLSLETLRFSGFGLDACDQEAITQIYEETGVDVEKLKSCKSNICSFFSMYLRSMLVVMTKLIMAPFILLQPLSLDVHIAKTLALGFINFSLFQIELRLLQGTVLNAEKDTQYAKERCGSRSKLPGLEDCYPEKSYACFSVKPNKKMEHYFEYGMLLLWENVLEFWKHTLLRDFH